MCVKQRLDDGPVELGRVFFGTEQLVARLFPSVSHYVSNEARFKYIFWTYRLAN